jgi:hypothetical protein
MKSTELRIGNLVYDTKGYVNTIDLEAITYIFKESLNQVKPIPLTEEWLLKFGFKNRPDGICDHWHLGINPITHDWMIELKNLGAGFFYINGYFNIKYVHQLQNLYFALTGEELAINELP